MCTNNTPYQSSQRSKYLLQFFTKLDISLHNFEIDESSQELCIIVTQIQTTPMGLKCSPDLAQQVMEEVLQDINNTTQQIKRSLYLYHHAIYQLYTSQK